MREPNFLEWGRGFLKLHKLAVTEVGLQTATYPSNFFVLTFLFLVMSHICLLPQGSFLPARGFLPVPNVSLWFIFYLDFPLFQLFMYELIYLEGFHFSSHISLLFATSLPTSPVSPPPELQTFCPHVLPMVSFPFCMSTVAESPFSPHFITHQSLSLFWALSPAHLSPLLSSYYCQGLITSCLDALQLILCTSAKLIFLKYISVFISISNNCASGKPHELWDLYCV